MKNKLKNRIAKFFIVRQRRTGTFKNIARRNQPKINKFIKNPMLKRSEKEHPLRIIASLSAFKKSSKLLPKKDLKNTPKIQRPLLRKGKLTRANNKSLKIAIKKIATRNHLGIKIKNNNKPTSKNDRLSLKEIIIMRFKKVAVPVKTKTKKKRINTSKRHIKAKKKQLLKANENGPKNHTTAEFSLPVIQLNKRKQYRTYNQPKNYINL